ncbi:adenylate/guanylate cyclase domain-containing protein [Microvirga sp. VF16]|uniref:adenylate/guanylate cyclase domain-containing protein n=1 Tax=Microvirga sp. VF16 TaxID=2807101 RepID=UPI00193D5089|nr:adenylate/guanylate cyclase domain-containing protein [Microvirga sp. VF16]QRM34677.1 hypothetical protein JO965_41075 [Microvirga sp. VF16]
MKSYVNRALAQAEREADRLLAYLRVLVAIAITIVFWATGALDQDHMAMLAIAGLGSLAAVSLATAWAGYFRPWLPWLFATLDVGLLLHCIRALAMSEGFPVFGSLGAPGALLIFLFLATAAVRHRPFLVLYTGVLFVAGWAVLWATTGTTHMAADVHLDSVTIATEMARLAVIGLTATILFVAVQRTRRALTAAITEARLRTNLARFFSPRIADKLAESGHDARPLRAQKAAVMFVDIRGFTTMAESLQDSELAAFLNEYRRRVSLPVAEHGGVIDKFIGDGVMAVFGVPEPDERDARNAVDCGVALLAAVDRWNEERANAGLAPVHIGIGIHYGDVSAGILGESHSLEFTVIGDTVNAANRIEELAGGRGMRLLVSAAALAAAGRTGDAAWALLPEQALRGRRQPIQVMRWREGRVEVGSVAIDVVIDAPSPVQTVEGPHLQGEAFLENQCTRTQAL